MSAFKGWASFHDSRKTSDIWAPFYWHGLTLIPAWINNHMPCKMWDEITYPFINFNVATVETVQPLKFRDG